jgi:hypothetical protein
MVSSLLILSLSAIIVILTLIIFQKSRKHQTNINYLMASLISIALANTAVGLGLDNPFVLIIMTNFLPLGILFLFFHYEFISQSRPRLYLLIYLLSLFLFLLSFKFILAIYILLEDVSLDTYYLNLRLYDDIFMNTVFRMSNIIQSLLILSVFIFASLTIIKELKITKLKALKIESIGLTFLLIYGLTYLIRDFFFYNSYYDIFTSAALIFSLIGLLFIISNFIIHPDYLYLLPFPIYNFMIFNEGGTLCYLRKVQGAGREEPKKNLEHLLAGAFTAVSNMFKEVLGAGANIRYIDADNFFILVTSLPDKKGVFVVISQGETGLLKNSIIRFTRTWTPQLIDEINGFVDLNELRPKIDKLIKSSFPYVNF